MISDKSSTQSYEQYQYEEFMDVQIPQEQQQIVSGGTGKHHGHMHGKYKLQKQEILKRETSKSSSQKKQKKRSRQKGRRRPFYGTEEQIQKRMRQMTPQRRAKKQAMREERNKTNQNILLKHKTENPYYDKQIDTHQQQKYYINLQKINYQNLNHLLSTTWEHARRRQNLFPIIDRHPDYTLRCVYSGAILSDAQGKMLIKCDQQHSFPQSFQRGKKSGTGRDMHAIFAASKSANGSRGNMPFGMHSVEDKLIEENQYGKIYSSKGNRKTYVPKMNAGAIARSTLYILTTYKGCANPGYFSKDLLPWLIQTASKEPVSDWQKHRNAELFRLQGNRNPFVDYPQWATKIDFTKGWQE